MKLPVPGDVLLDKYRIDSVLGEGGFGRVYGATTIATNRPVAIKVLKTGSSLDAAARVSRFLREMRAIAKLQSPHTITLFDYGRLDDGAPFMVCEHIDGEDLSDLLHRRGPLSQNEALHILEQMLRSLAEAHDVGVLHRDIKPSNVRVFEYAGDPLRAKLLDFGLAKSLTDDEARLTNTGNVIGTPRYMSPEQLNGIELTPASDVYSAGLVAVEMLIGSEAFRALPIIGDRHVPSGLVDPRLASIINRMVADGVSERWQSAADVVEALTSERSVEKAPYPRSHQPSRPAPSTRVERRISPTRPRPPVAGLIVLAGLAMLGLVVAVVVGLDEEPQTVVTSRSGSRASALLRASDPVQVQAIDAGSPDLGAETTRLESETGCGGEQLAGARKVSVLDGLSERSLDAYVPQGYDPTVPHPLLLLLHESGDSPTDFINESGFIDIAERDGVVIAAPFGGVGDAWKEGAQHTVRRTIDDVLSILCIDEERIFAVGHSSGGGVIESAGCRLPRIRAIATTALRRRKTSGDRCGESPTPVIHLVGRDDGYNPIAGGKSCSGSIKMSLAEKEERWARRNQCDDRSAVWLEHRGGRCRSWEGCAAPLVSCVLDGGRGWNGTGDRLLDVYDCDGVAADFPYAETIWAFFASLEQ